MANRIKFGPGCGCCGEPIVIGDVIVTMGCCIEGWLVSDPDCEQADPCSFDSCSYLRITGTSLCDIGSQDACIPWTSGTTFSGTAANGATWTVTFVFDCTAPNCGAYISSASVVLGGLSITWTLVGTDPNWYYDIDVVGMTCPAPGFSARPAKKPRSSAAATVDVAISNVTTGDTAGNPTPIEPACCALLNDTFTLSLITPPIAGPCSGLNGATWQYEMNPGNLTCSAVITLSVESSTGFGGDLEGACGTQVALDITIFRLDPDPGDFCTWRYRRVYCGNCSQTITFSDIDCVESPSPECGCGGTACITVAGSIPP